MSEYDELLKELELVPSPHWPQLLDAYVESTKARAECERQYQAKVEEVVAQMNRAEAAEADVERLKGVLEEIANTLKYAPDDEGVKALYDFARSALEAKP